MVERVAVIFSQGPFCRSPNVSKDESGSGLRGNTMEIGAVPGGYGGCEETRRRAKLWVSVETDTEAICIVLATSCILLPKNLG
jgi:hypothetical protein